MATKLTMENMTIKVGVLSLIVLAAIVIAGVKYFSEGSGKPMVKVREAHLYPANVGDKAYLSFGDDKTSVLVANSKEHWDRLIDLSVAGDDEGIALMRLSGQVFRCEPMTEVTVIDKSIMGWTEVRILTGDHRLNSGFASRELVVR